MKLLKTLSTLSTADARCPTSLLTLGLSEEELKSFDAIKSRIKLHFKEESSLYEVMMEIVDSVNTCNKSFSVEKSHRILTRIVEYLRVQLLSNDPRRVERSVTILDILVKNCGYRLHTVVAKRLVMKTISIVGRRLLALPGGGRLVVGELIMDILQGWGEAFLSRRHLYPEIYNTYMKLRFKYRVRFQRPDFDPTRVPIFLGPIGKAEYQWASHQNANNAALGPLWEQSANEVGVTSANQSPSQGRCLQGDLTKRTELEWCNDSDDGGGSGGGFGRRETDGYLIGVSPEKPRLQRGLSSCYSTSFRRLEFDLPENSNASTPSKSKFVSSGPDERSFNNRSLSDGASRRATFAALQSFEEKDLLQLEDDSSMDCTLQQTSTAFDGFTDEIPSAATSHPVAYEPEKNFPASTQLFLHDNSNSENNSALDPVSLRRFQAPHPEAKPVINSLSRRSHSSHLNPTRGLQHAHATSDGGSAQKEAFLMLQKDVANLFLELSTAVDENSSSNTAKSLNANSDSSSSLPQCGAKRRALSLTHHSHSSVRTERKVPEASRPQVQGPCNDSTARQGMTSDLPLSPSRRCEGISSVEPPSATASTIPGTWSGTPPHGCSSSSTTCSSQRVPSFEMHPATDPSVDIRFFGTQRVVSRKNTL